MVAGSILIQTINLIEMVCGLLLYLQAYAGTVSCEYDWVNYFSLSIYTLTQYLAVMVMLW